MGREVAQTTVTSLVRDYYATPETWDTTVALDRVIAAQNAWLASINRRRQPAMGLTTLTALVLCGQFYTVAHVGDSRAYLLRDGELLQLTHDHVMSHPDFKHQLLRSVGAEDYVVVDYLQGELLVGDVFVLVTDGVHHRPRQNGTGGDETPNSPSASAQDRNRSATNSIASRAGVASAKDNL